MRGACDAKSGSVHGRAHARRAARAADVEPDDRTPVDRYYGDATFALLSCEIKARTALMCAAVRRAPGKVGDWRSVIAEGMRQAKKNHAAALRTLADPAAGVALAAHHAAFVAALKGMGPIPNEEEHAYGDRVWQLKEREAGAWESFERAQAAAARQAGSALRANGGPSTARAA